jgi:serine/threonine protein kinase
MAFMLCYQKQPFESRLSAINKQYFLPENNCYSTELVSFIEKCFTTNPTQRPSATEIKN